MGLYTKNDEQTDNYYEVVSINKSLSKQIFFLKFLFSYFNFSFIYDY